MHSIYRNDDKTWSVARVTTVWIENAAVSDVQVMFDRLSFGTALRLVNCLNGGASIDVNSVVEMCAV